MDDLQMFIQRTTLGDQAPRAASEIWSILCSSCRKMFQAKFESRGDDEYGTKGVHHTTAIECKQAAQAGCSICHTVWQRATQYGDLDVLALNITGNWFSRFHFDRRSTLMDHHGRVPGNSMVLNIYLGSITRARGMEIKHRVALDSVLFALQPTSLHPTLFDHEVTSKTTSSKETWDLLEGWMAHCRENCKCLRAPGPGATSAMARILDVGAIGDPQIQLRSRAQLSDKISYITLSHCWGSAMTCRLYNPKLEWQADGKGITLEEAARGIKVNALPKTFRDAVEVTRRLGVRYLWIDSLCIIQNSEADWKKESFAMGLLYANAYLTLAADGAKDSYEGLFYERDAATARPLVVHCSQYKEFLGEEMFVLLPADFWREMVSDTNVGRRAWCMQERALSNAIIHFGRKQVAWECKGSDFCETFPKGLPASLQDENPRFIALLPDNGRSLPRQFKPAPTRPPIYEGSSLTVYETSEDLTLEEDERATMNKAGSIVERDIKYSDSEREALLKRVDVAAVGTESLDKYYIWSRLVEKYSRTNITYDSDRLVGIYGVAVIIGVLSLKDLYVAGTWDSTLPSQLVWSVDNGVRRDTLVAKFPQSTTPSWSQGRRPNIRNAPSWSWAAVRAPILMPTPLRAGALIKASHFSPNKEYLDDGFHEETFLSVSGNLHSGQLNWSSELGMYIVIMKPDGYGNTVIHEDDGVPRSADQGHVMVEVVPDPPRAAKNKKYTASSSNGDGDPLCGIAHLDSSDDIDLKGSDSCPIICLPVIDTRSHRKHALHEDVTGALTGVSGLLLVPAETGSSRLRGFYKRVGVFSLIGEKLVRLRARTGPKNLMERFFRAADEGDLERYIILA